jgi:DNA-binding transcriptional regulator YhcF (GntR family)
MEFKDHQAIYLQIADHFFENILSGSGTAGRKSPPSGIRPSSLK